MNDINIEYLGRNGQMGPVQAMLQMNGLDTGRMRPFVDTDGRSYVSVYKGAPGADIYDPDNYITMPIQTNGTLRRDEWVRLDEALLAISETRLGGVEDLVSRGLTFDLGNGMATTVLEYHDSSDAMTAELTMDGVTRSKGDRMNFESVYLPLPILHSDFEINARVLAASRNLGNPLDTTSSERATRKVLQGRENLLFTNTSYAYANGTIYSYLNHPNRNIGSLTGAWTGLTGAQILVDVLNMKQAAIDALHFGSYALYVPTEYETVLDKDFDTTTATGRTIRERIMQIESIDSIKTIDTLTAATVLLVQMTSDVVRLVRGMPLQNVQWDTEGGMITKYKVMTIQVPQVRADQDGNSGVVHYSV